MCQTYSHVSVIQKSKKREQYVLHRVANELEPIIKKGLINGIEAIKNKITFIDIEQELERRGITYFPSLIDWTKMDDTFAEAISDSLMAGIDKASQVVIEEMPQKKTKAKILPKITPDIEFNLNNPRIRAFVDARITTMSGAMLNGGAEAIETVVKLNFERGYSSRQIARIIKPSIGLTERQAVAVSNLANSLYISGKSEAKVSKQIGSYAGKLLNQRAENIARTEVMTAVNYGQTEVWEQGAEQGLFDKAKATKQWETVPDDLLCEYCEAMDGQEVGLDDMFDGGELADVMSPPVHPSCRCLKTLNFND